VCPRIVHCGGIKAHNNKREIGIIGGPCDDSNPQRKNTKKVFLEMPALTLRDFEFKKHFIFTATSKWR